MSGYPTKNDILRASSKLKSVPPSALEAVRLLQDSNSRLDEVVRVINYDPGLTANVLKLVNSSFFGGHRSVLSLKDAIVRLGSSSLFKLLATSIANMTLSNGIKSYNIEPGELWTHSLAVAVASEDLAKRLNRTDPVLAFTSGLLHDLGKVVLGNFITDEILTEIRKYLEEGYDFYDAERNFLSVSHAELGAYILRTWNIPEDLVTAIRWHHRPILSGSEPAAAIVNAADWICIEGRVGSSEHYNSVSRHDDVFAKLGITRRMMESVIEHTFTTTEQIKSDLKSF